MSMTIGKYRVDVVDTGSFALDGGAMFGVVPKPLWERAYTTADERNRIPMVARCLLLRSPDKTILVDVGNSPATPAKQQEIYRMDFSEADIERSLLRLGVLPADVTDVILTHLHFDHAGASVVASGDAFVPRFPRARYYVQKEQFAWAQHPSDKDRASFVSNNFMPLYYNGSLEVLDGPGELFPDIHLELFNGHTTALQSVRVTDGANTIFFPSDLMPTGAHVPYPYVMGYDNFPLTSLAEKMRVLPKASDEQWTVVFQHDALRQAGTVTIGDKGARLLADVVITDPTDIT